MKFKINLKMKISSLGGSFPDLEITNPEDEGLIMNLIYFLEQRINKRNFLRADLEQKSKLISCQGEKKM